MSEDLTKVIKFLKLHPDAKLPTRGSKQSAGLDLYSVAMVSITPGERAAVRTGVSAAIPAGYYGRVAPRSGLALERGIDVMAGVIDSDYRGEIICLLVNLGEESVQLECGTRVAQLIVEAIITPEPEWADELVGTERGSDGFGSTDKE
jgi:dUTP pyrophosphatase